MTTNWIHGNPNAPHPEFVRNGVRFLPKGTGDAVTAKGIKNHEFVHIEHCHSAVSFVNANRGEVSYVLPVDFRCEKPV